MEAREVRFERQGQHLFAVWEQYFFPSVSSEETSVFGQKLLSTEEREREYPHFSFVIFIVYA